MPETLTQEQGQTLLDLARTTLIQELDGDQDRLPAKLDQRLRDPVFDQNLGTFVTLHLHGNLRGCIGSLVGSEPLRDNIRSNARNAAFRDPRFPPLTKGELTDVDIEISVLTTPQPLDYASTDDLVRKLRPGKDGVILQKGTAQSTFLPQVWEQLPEPDAFLSNLCLKAGLPSTAWKDGDLQIFTYQVQSFAEKGQ
ncbi:AmmeMemoRadiSam system protein A [Desulfovermiculus halophilus]|jgi:AmmeMemoRadiSam system protein A|uniref:AmmeMemoRadiSam system protein A n=1 Tax=Desulfovermiculus halophilus TaxID=339722 RepID=UPI000480E043|nr:AmmeMemoRadiSam system protein A [Desulfovermiculus halophilus]